jgi:hypothetical protein
MACRWCRSENPAEFRTEMNLHFPGRMGLEIPSVLTFPMVGVCLDCGFAEFTRADNELSLLGAGVEVLV